MSDPTYPPLDVPKPVATDMWIVDSGPLKAMGVVPLPVRMTVVRLSDGSLLLHSPTRFVSSLRDALEAIGPIRHLVAPNSAHWTFVKSWQTHVPDAVTWAAPGLRERAQVKRSRVRLDHDLASTPPPEWGDAFDLVQVPGAGGFLEVCMFHRPSQTLVLTDLIQNLERQKLPAPFGAFAALLGATAPSGRAPIYLRAVVKAKGEAALAAARQLVALAPQRVIFTHGQWFEADGAARLKRSLDWLI